MKANQTHPLSFFNKLRLKKLYNTSKFTENLKGLESSILLELNGFVNLGEISKFHSDSLILGEYKANREQDARTKIKLFLRILETPGLFRWLCFWFFTPVLEKAYEITRTKLSLKILADHRKFSREVLSRLHLLKIDIEKLAKIPVGEFSNPNSNVSLSVGKSYLLESGYFQRLVYSKRKLNQLKNYQIAKIITWDSRYAISLIQGSTKLNNSADLHRFLDAFPEFKQKLESRRKVKVTFHSNSGDTLDQRLEKQGLITPDSVVNAQIWHQRFIVVNSEWLLIDETCSPQIDFVAGHSLFIEQTRLLSGGVSLQKPAGGRQINLAEAIFLIGRADENWYHLLLDTLPRYLWFESLDSHVPVLVRSDLPKTSIDLLCKLIPRTLIFVEPNDTVSVALLHFIAGRSTVFDSEPISGLERVKFSPENLRKMKNWILGTLSASEEIEFPKKIFINRSSKYRNLINSRSVAEKLAKQGYEKLECTEQFFLHQSEYFARANHIVTPGGAVLANILFMKEGSRVTAIRSTRGSDLRLWEKLAQACGIEFTEVIGIPSYFGPNSLERQHSNYFLPLKRLNKIFLNQKFHSE
jgi:hypothetical protein